MPFKDNKELTEKVKGTHRLSERKKRQWRHVFDKCFEEKGEDPSCYAMAWGAVNRTASAMPCAARELLRVARALCLDKRYN